MARIGWHSLRFGGLGRGTVQTTGGLLGRALLQAAYLVVISARDVIDNPFLMPHDAHRYAGIPT